jgi:hypothetical protein
MIELPGGLLELRIRLGRRDQNPVHGREPVWIGPQTLLLVSVIQAEIKM